MQKCSRPRPEALKKMDSFVKEADNALLEINKLQISMSNKKWNPDELPMLKYGDIIESGNKTAPDFQEFKTFAKNYITVKNQLEKLKTYQEEYRFKDDYQPSIDKKLIAQINHLEEKEKILAFQFDILKSLVKLEEAIQDTSNDPINILDARSSLIESMSNARIHFDETKNNSLQSYCDYLDRGILMFETRTIDLSNYILSEYKEYYQ